MNRSVSIRSRPRRTRATSARALSYRMRAGTPPSRAKAVTWPSRNASWPSDPKATWTATPEWREAQLEDRHRRPLAGDEHVGQTEVDLGLLARLVVGDDRDVDVVEMELAAALPDVPADRALGDVGALLVDQALPDPARRVALLAGRVAVLGQPLADRGGMGTDRRQRPVSTGLRGGGTADASACRTARRCTLCRRASSRIDTPSSRCSRRIRSNCSTLDNSFLRRSHGLARPGERDGR